MSQIINGAKINVRSAPSSAPAPIASMGSSSSPVTFIDNIQETVAEEAKATMFDVVTFPNPSTAQFNVKVQSDNSKEVFLSE